MLILEGHRDSTILDISFDSDAGAPSPPGTAPPRRGLGSAEARPRPYSAAARLPLRLAASWALRDSDPAEVAPRARRKLGLTRTGSPRGSAESAARGAWDHDYLAAK
jgi:hypothetical protein